MSKKEDLIKKAQDLNIETEDLTIAQLESAIADATPPVHSAEVTEGEFLFPFGKVKVSFGGRAYNLSKLKDADLRILAKNERFGHVRFSE